MAVRIEFRKEESRSAALDGDKVIGECDVAAEPGMWTITHTIVDPAYGGQGIAAKLLDSVMKEAEKAGVKINPVCSYAAAKCEKVEEYRKLVQR